MKKLLLALCATVPALSLGACATDYGDGRYGSAYYGGPYSYTGYYDGFYGPIYDGYWGRDNYFYYRGGVGDRAYRRGDRTHFSRSAASGGNWQRMQGTMTPSSGMTMPQFRHGGGGGRGHRRGG